MKKWFIRKKKNMPKTLMFQSLYLCNPMLQTFDISTINYIRSNSVSLKYQSFTPSGCHDIGIRIIEFITKKWKTTIIPMCSVCGPLYPG